MFSDGIYGGKKKAYAIAEKYRDKCIKKLSKKDRNRLERSARYGKAWGAGVTLRTRLRDGRVIERFWYATYWCRETNTQKKKHLSIKKWGYHNGKKIAQHFRDKGILKVAKFGKAA